MDPQALYYTLSTIAQTLAGALAILVAVVLFKLTGLAQTIERGKDEMRALNLDVATAWPILREHGYEAFAVSQSKVLNPSPGMRGGWEATHSAYKTWGGINRRLQTQSHEPPRTASTPGAKVSVLFLISAEPSVNSTCLAWSLGALKLVVDDQ